MLNIGWGEMAVIAVVTLIVVGPKELPNVLRTGAHWMRQVRKLSREFQSGVDSLVREAELDEAKNIVTSVKRGTIGREIEKAVDPTGEISKSLDPKQIAREANAATSPKPAPVAPKQVATDTGAAVASEPASAAAPNPTSAKPAAVVIGPVGSAPSKPSSADPVAEPATPAPDAQSDPARKTGS
jgi:sec-independent protein translocase protein TatB